VGPGHPRLATLAGAALLTALCLLGLAAEPVAADPARPTNFRSRIISVEPSTSAARVEIAGGDSFVVLSVEPGHEVVVPDYGAEGTDRPYLRFRADGTVELNEASAAASANESRYGSSSERFDPDAAPRWRRVAGGGSYAWHDHRIHLMVPEDMAVVDERGRVDLGGGDGTWQVPLIVDGSPTVVTGELLRMELPPTPAWYIGALTLLGFVVVALVRARRALWPVRVALLSVGATAAFVSFTELSEAPEGSGASAAPLGVARVAVFGAASTLLAPRLGARARSVARGGTALAAATLTWWALDRLDVLRFAVLPSGLGDLDRAATAAAFSVGLGTAVVLLWRPARLLDEPGTTVDQTAPAGHG
jgi:hypothetical protein